ncbi:CD209 antigen-like protein E [Dinothrombium tinctorium]|uniref:CD209 antigen-like protein E n=1 Tax=Dinothrombium tinctorium TaxID=1965070 RepID=A0A3S3P724_9ACAR|nr:CD209 antigen-like protein E [Dinothrombium tinctorium]
MLSVVECLQGWHRFQNKCFYIGTNEFNAEEAFNQCKALKSHLATIHSIEEEDFLENLIQEKKFYRIGLLPTTYKPNSVVWIDGSPVNYTNWLKNDDPNYVTTKCGWVSISKGVYENQQRTVVWHDDDCSEKRNFICEQKIGKKQKFQIEKYPENNVLQFLIVNQANLMDELDRLKKEFAFLSSGNDYCRNDQSVFPPGQYEDDQQPTLRRFGYGY